MTNAGLPVPPGFTIQTEACREYMRTGGVSKDVDRQMDEALAKLETLQGQKLGTGENPLLVSVALGREVLHARNDGHDPQPRLERQERRSACQAQQQSALRGRFLPRLIQMFATSCSTSRSRRSRKYSTPRRSRRRPSSTLTSTRRRCRK